MSGIDPVSAGDVQAGWTRLQLEHLRARLHADLARTETLIDALTLRRGRLVLLSIAAAVTASTSDVVSFAIYPSATVPRQWHLAGLHGTDGQPVPFVSRETALEIGHLLDTHRFAFHPDLLPLDTVTDDVPERSTSHIKVASMLELGEATPLTVIDFSHLSEGDFSEVWHAADEQLGLVGAVRTRGNFIQQVEEHEALRADVTEEQLTLAADVARARYMEELDDTHFMTQVEPQLFFNAIDEAVDFLDLTKPSDLPLAFHPPTSMPQAPDREH